MNSFFPQLLQFWKNLKWELFEKKKVLYLVWVFRIENFIFTLPRMLLLHNVLFTWLLKVRLNLNLVHLTNMWMGFLTSRHHLTQVTFLISMVQVGNNKKSPFHSSHKPYHMSAINNNIREIEKNSLALLQKNRNQSEARSDRILGSEYCSDAHPQTSSHR